MLIHIIHSIQCGGIKNDYNKYLKISSSYFYMKVNIYTITWNEEILLPYFIKFYKNHFPNIDLNFIIYDNESTDKTIEIATNNNCIIKTFSTNNTINDIEYLNIKNNCWKNSNADWVIIVDCDEFIDIYKQDLYKLENDKYNMVKTLGYNMINTIVDIPHTRSGARSIWYDKNALFMPKYIKEINYNPGCHYCEPIGYNINICTNVFKLYHFKRLSLEYYLDRIRLCRNRLSNINIAYKFGTHFLASDEEHINDFNKILQESTLIIYENLFI